MDCGYEFILEEAENEYYCILCGCDMNSDYNVEQHYHGKRHADSLEKYENDISDCGGNEYYCNVCDCTIKGYQNVRQHVIGQRHNGGSESEASEASDECIQYSALKPEDFIVEQDDSDLLECFLCNLDIADSRSDRYDHLHSRKHKKAVKMYGSDILGSDEDCWYSCKLCDCEISSYKNVYDHLMGKGHQSCMK